MEEEEILLPGSEDEERATERLAFAEPHSHDTLYLFGRTGREKEEWFQHFLSASRDSRLDGSPSREQSKAGTLMLPMRWRWVYDGGKMSMHKLRPAIKPTLEAGLYRKL